jgi:hypothetical protein
MNINEKFIKELNRHNAINNYITEQEADPTLPPPAPAENIPPSDTGMVPPSEGTPPVPPEVETESIPVDVESDPEVEKIGSEKKKESKSELEITDLVKSQENIGKKQEEYFDNLFKHLDDLESKLSNMDQIVQKLNDLESKIEKYRVKTPEEKLELRSLDSGPFNQKLSDFFDDKQEDMEKTGKNEYILTKDDVESYSPYDIKKSFRDFGDEESGDFVEVR